MLAFPVLETDRLILRELKDGDAPALFKFRSDLEVQKYNGGPMLHLDEALSLVDLFGSGFREKTRIEWGVTVKNCGDFVIGDFGFANWSHEHRRAEIGYCLSREFWGQGIAFEALTAIVEFGFKEMDLNRIHACPRVANVASTRILEKLGFKLEGVLRDEFWEDGAFHDEAHYALLLRDFLQR